MLQYLLTFILIRHGEVEGKVADASICSPRATNLESLLAYMRCRAPIELA